MKRNESILVYGVTTLLVVILLIAVVFGNENKPPMVPGGPGNVAEGAGSGAMDLSEIMNLDPVGPLRDAEAEGVSSIGEGPPGPEVGPEEAGTGEAGTGEPGDPAAGEQDPAPIGTALGADPGAAAATPAVLGADPRPAMDGTVRVGDFLQVPIRDGDTFSTLVQRWCGSLDQLPLAEALNEDLNITRLPIGQTVLLPWVDAEERARIRASQPVPAVAEKGTYEVKSGDSLWRIASQATGDQRSVPDFIARIMKLNPGLVPERLQVGQEIVLPR